MQKLYTIKRREFDLGLTSLVFIFETRPVVGFIYRFEQGHLQYIL